ncbi:hypothetical protein V499_06282 [Pseudogymnoascus sp. VKM F-103]|nr:hypothetical protein V499_06282 [Pseudogymnoascus sp. VKM F-103]
MMRLLTKKRDASGRHKKAETEEATAIEGRAGIATDTASVLQEPGLYSTTESAGIKVVAMPSDAILDIVFVHGLIGHREDTWTHKNGLFWPALLAKDINSARIMTFGYDASVIKLKGMVGDNNIRNHGKNLATDVSDQRRDCRNRPIIFIAHSLGGLVCEQALLYCMEKGKFLEKVFWATRGIIFMGTPHAGADLAALAHSLAKYLNIVRRTNKTLLDSLRRDSDELTAAQQRFQTLLLKPEVNIEIYCFFEEQAVAAIGIIVPESSAVLSQYDNQSIAANHMDMTKFSDVNDGGYQKVVNRVKDIIEAIEPSDICSNVLQAPKDPSKHLDYERRYKCHRIFRTSEYERHKERNPSPVEGTCQWFLQHQNYTSWRDSPNSKILWVSANPGCGKSVLSRLLADKELQANQLRTTGYFFFKDDNEEQKTATNALCALLHQIFNQNPVLLRHAIKIVDSNGEENVKNSIDLLWEILITVAEDPRAGEIVCILDALDECKQLGLNPLLQKLCSFYAKQSQLSNKIALKFLMTTRPLQHIEDEFNDLSQKMPKIRLSGEEHTDQIRREIDLVINYEINKIQQKWTIDQSTVYILQEEFSKVEHRTYLWLMLIFDLIRQDLQSVTKKGRERLFRTIPKSVNDAYTAILNKSKDKDLARKLLQIVCAATRPLSVKEIITALWIEEDYKTYKDLEIPSEDYSKAYIRNLCGLRWKNSISIQDSSLILASSCMWFLRLKELNDSSLTPDGIKQLNFRYEFYDYSIKNWAFHFKNNAVTDGHPLIKVGFELCNVEASRYMSWRLWHTTLDPRFSGFRNLHWASSFGLEKVVCLLLATPGINVNIAGSCSQTPLHQAALNGDEAVMRLLLAAPGIDVNAADNYGCTPLWDAAYNGHEAVMRLLLAAPGIDVNAADNYGCTPLWQAASDGDEMVMRLLLAAPGIDVNSSNDDGQTPLWEAASNHGISPMWKTTSPLDKVVRLLLAAPGIDVNAADSNGRTPLWQAACKGDLAFVPLLLAAPGIDVNAADTSGKTPLSRALECGWKQDGGIIKLLENRSTTSS